MASSAVSDLAGQPSEATVSDDERGWLSLVVRRLPFTTSVLFLLVAVGVGSRGLFTPVSAADWYERYAYGVPALQQGHWWSLVTGTFLVDYPLLYLPMLAFVAGSLGWLEWRRGTRTCAGYFVGGQILALILTAAALLLLVGLGSPWASALSQQYDVGPSAGAFACLTAAVCSLPSPWRGRGQLVLAAFSVVSVVYIGSKADVEHAVAIALVLALKVRGRSHPTTRERRFVAWVALASLAAVQLVTALVPTFGPFGATDAEVDPRSLVDVAVDTAAIALLAHGLRRGYRLAWVLALLLAAVNVVVGLLSSTVLVVARDQIEGSVDPFSLAAASAVLWALVLGYLLRTRSAFRARLRRRVTGGAAGRREDVRRIVESTGGGPLSWMGTWPDNAHFFTEDLDGVIAYQVHSGVAIALADPVAPEPRRRGLLADFVDASERAGLLPCVFGASEQGRALAPQSWRSVQIAEDTIVDLPGLAFTGKRWAKVRAALNRAQREGLTFRLTTLVHEPWSVRRQVDAISEQWVGDKGLPEMRFTLGTVEEALDPAVRVALAEVDGVVEGFLSWLPIYGPRAVHRGWTLDLMRRRDGGSPAVMEYLIASSAAAFRDEGAALLSLSGAPLARSTPGPSGGVDRLLERLAESLEPVYGFRSLHQFKQKFNPRAEPVYLLYPNEVDLPRVGVGLTRAFLPDATVGDFVRAGTRAMRKPPEGNREVERDS